MNEISLAEYRQQIEGAIERGRFRESVAHVRRILETYPKDRDAYWLAGKAMLEAGQYEHAADMLRRVLSADPEHMLAWAGMSKIAEERDQLGAAIWYMERAFELATDNETVAEELRRLYGDLEGSRPQRLQLTQGALARLYLLGDLLTRAITELRTLLTEHPDRIDLKVSLAEALWRNGQRLEASEVCQEILEVQPYNLKANLILGEIWTSSGRPEGEVYLEHAQAVDPENALAQKLFGPTSPLPSAAPRITPLEYAYPPEGERPPWMDEIGELPAAEEVGLAEIGEAMEAQIEIPAWLQEMAGEDALIRPPAVGPRVEAPTVDLEEAVGLPGAVPAPADEMKRAERVFEEKGALEEGALEEGVLGWLTELGREGRETMEEAAPSPAVEDVSPPGPVAEEEIPAWLAEIGLEPPVREARFRLAEDAGFEEPEPAEIPDWLAGLAPPEAPTAAPHKAPETTWEEEIPEVTIPPVEEIEEVAPEPKEPFTWERGVPFDKMKMTSERSPWLEVGLERPDDDLAWLEELAEDIEEEELLTEAESEARLAEILEMTAPLEEEAAPEVGEEVIPVAEAEEAAMEEAFIEEGVRAEEVYPFEEAAVEEEFLAWEGAAPPETPAPPSAEVYPFEGAAVEEELLAWEAAPPPEEPAPPSAEVYPLEGAAVEEELLAWEAAAPPEEPAPPSEEAYRFEEAALEEEFVAWEEAAPPDEPPPPSEELYPFEEAAVEEELLVWEAAAPREEPAPPSEEAYRFEEAALEEEFVAWEEAAPVEEPPPSEEMYPFEEAASEEELVAWEERAPLEERIYEEAPLEAAVPPEAAAIEEGEAEREPAYGDEALSWLERLVKEKEEDLLAEAEIEAEAEAAESVELEEEEAPVIEPAGPAVPEVAALAPAMEEPVALEEEAPLPEALEPAAFEKPRARLAEEAIPSAEEALGWLERLTEVGGPPEVVPEEAPPVEPLPAEEVVFEPEEAAFGWTAFTGEPIAVEEVEEAPPFAAYEEVLEPTAAAEEAAELPTLEEITAIEEIEAAIAFEEAEEQVALEPAEEEVLEGVAEPALAAEEPAELAPLEEATAIEEIEAVIAFEEAEELMALEPAEEEVLEEIAEPALAAEEPEEVAWLEGISAIEEVEAAIAFEEAEELAVIEPVAEEALEEVAEPELMAAPPEELAPPEEVTAIEEVEAPVAFEEAEEPVALEPLEEALEPVPPFVEPTEVEGPAAEVAEEVAPFLEPVEVAVPAEAFEDIDGFIAARQAHAADHPGDHESWLELGRLLWQADRRSEAFETYCHLIASGSLLEEVIPDLEDYADQWPEAEAQQALGDAYMKADRLSDALDMYRQAMAKL